MDAQPPPRPDSVPPTTAFEGDALAQRWRALLDELTALNTKLEYLNLMLKLGVRRF